MGDMSQIWGFLGCVVLFAGIYALRAYFLMKKRGTIDGSLLLGKDVSVKKCGEPQIYMKKAGRALLIFSLAAIVYGGTDIINCFVYPIPKADMILMLIFVCVLVWFGVYTGKLKQRYF